MQRELLIEAPGKIALRPARLSPRPAPGTIRAQSLLTGISHGTEMTFFQGTSPFDGKELDPEKHAADLALEQPGHGLRLRQISRYLS